MSGSRARLHALRCVLLVLPFVGQAPADPVRATDPRLEQLVPGTVVEDGPPAGWDRLIIKSLPRVVSGDTDRLPASAHRIATLYRTVITARVVPAAGEPGRWQLDAVGVGLCMPDARGRDVVVTSDRQPGLEDTLGTVERLVLRAAEAELNKGRLVFASPTFAVYRGPAALLVEGTHHQVEVFYALRLDPRTGSLRTACWACNTMGPEPSRPSMLTELPANLVWDCGLDVRAGRLLGLLDVHYAFAMRELPPGRRVAVPPALATRLAAPGPGDAAELERALTAVLGPPRLNDAPAPGAVAGSGPVRSGPAWTAGSGPPGTSRRAR